MELTQTMLQEQLVFTPDNIIQHYHITPDLYIMENRNLMHMSYHLQECY